ncbi:MAG: 4-hydroxythreonine-4-phosphate dehydrogenase PdxA [Bacteroidetes bacterium CG18_big_fil_WC_8_21_14_2_50_41_14]|nr:MAG: 4-hydroxythreonine-4-phosphate dehydrogenase PdxA [Bacteroidetes bacterium CG18_big_fil_WC_8_21_14_2_50_41_14]PJB58223.1 MAG: 4-hydroxythreonine-4-phosphate dehydrogenase PdxA [Bacteroidetes bacterium CG_4_9_14_3_um_filter_41_19]
MQKGNPVIEKDRKIRVGITHGDLNGINYEIIIKTLDDNRILELFTPVIYGLSRVLSYNRKNMNATTFNYNLVRDASFAKTNKINLVNLNDSEVKIEFGKSIKLAGEYAYEALKHAVADLKSHKINVVVTAPITKENTRSDDFPFPGHTEYFASEFHTDQFLMLMVSGNLRIGTVTGHVSLAEVPALLTEELITTKINVLHDSLIRDFGISRPKIALLGLNPHAGENGQIGHEEENLLVPAILKAKKKGKLVFGPFPADGFFAGTYQKYDGILAMYHDQGLIPFKTLSTGRGVNFTAGLPIVRTSPAHGTAYDIAGQGIASPDSLRNAMYLAVDIFNNRQNFDEDASNPLHSGLLQESGNGKNKEDNDEISRMQD